MNNCSTWTVLQRLLHCGNRWNRLAIATWALLYCGTGFAAPTLTVQRVESSAYGNNNLSAINDIIQDRKGFLWLATENGLLRYDSLRTVRYETEPNNDNSLSSQYAWSLTEDHRGHIWIATEHGLNQFNPGTHQFTRYLHSSNDTNSLSHNFTTRVIEGPDHKIYVATANGLSILSVDRSTIQRLQYNPDIPDENSLRSNQVRTVYADSAGFIWVGYNDQGASRFDPNQQLFRHFTHIPGDPNSLVHNFVRDISEDHLGRFWIATWGGGISRIDADLNSMTQFLPGTDSRQLQSGIVWDIFNDDKDQIWVALDKGGVARYDETTNSFHTYRHDPFDNSTLLHDTIKKICQDKNHNIWFATFPSGLNRYNPSTAQFTNWYHKVSDNNTLSDRAILSVHQSKDGLIWVGTGAGLNAIDRKQNTVTRYLHEKGDNKSLPADAVLSIGEAPNGDIWVGTWAGGLARLDRKTGKFDRYRIGTGKHAANSPYIWKIFFDRQGQLWLGTETDGLNKYDPVNDQFISYAHDINDPNSISFNFVWDIIENAQGQFWVGTQHGLNLFDPTTGVFTRFQDYGNTQGLGSARVQALLEDSKGYIWVATQSGGVKRWDPRTETVINLTTEVGLPDNTVSALEEDEQGYIWAATSAGIAKIDPLLLNIEEVLTTHLGIVGDIHNRNASLRGVDGSLYFGSTAGLTHFHPQELIFPTESSKVVLTDLKILNVPAEIGTNDSPLQRDISETSKIVLDHDATMFSLEFANLDFGYIGQHKFSYILEGFDSDWNIIHDRSEAIYTNLDSGHYVFKVRALNYDGQWSQHERSLSIFKTPPPWLSLSAYAAYMIGFIFIIYIFSRLLILRIINRKFNAEVAIRTEELTKANSAKTTFLANMSHELRTPLNSIIGFSRRLMVKYENQLDKQGVNALDAIYRNGHHLLGLINDILDLAKIESGKMELNIKPCNLKELITACIDDLKDAASAKDLTVTPPATYIHQVIRADAQRLTQIIYNLLSNAIKYTDKGHIALVVDEQMMHQKTFCTISVIDTGKGILKEDQDKLFRRFEQMDEDTRHIQGFGTGLGLALVAEFASLHGGQVTCHSIFGEGSQFTVFLPLTSVEALCQSPSTTPLPSSH